MKDQEKTKEQLISELADLRQEKHYRKQTEEKLRESEERFRSIVENTDAGYFFIDKDGFIQDVNDAWLNMYKYSSPEEVIGRHYRIIQKIKDVEKAKEFVAGIMREDNQYLTGEFSRKCKDGTIGYHTFSARPVVRSGETVGIEGFIIDTTDRKKVEEEREKLISDLQTASAKVKTLSGIIPICAKCKKVRDDKGYWNQVEVYVRDHTEAEFSHGLCPECVAGMEKEIDEME